MGPVVPDVETLTGTVDGPFVAVGDMVTYHLMAAGITPAVAVLDGHTERDTLDEEVRATLPIEDADRIPNAAGTLSAELVAALTTALDSMDGTVILVDGEEDLAAVPAIVAAPDDAVVVYGQPGEGMVAVVVDDETRARVRDLLARFEDTDRLWALLP
ncbi:MAG: GTP-dependent dephospho-CoA kinase family protein [Halobacteriaceae archaeon]